MSYAHGTPVGFEIPALDVARGAAFYTNVFGWTFSPSSHGFPAHKSLSFQVTGGVFPVGGAIRLVEAIASNVDVPKIYRHVDDIITALSTIEKNGGKKVSEVIPEGDVGRFQYIKDSEGNDLAIYQYNKK